LLTTFDSFRFNFLKLAETGASTYIHSRNECTPQL